MEVMCDYCLSVASAAACAAAGEGWVLMTLAGQASGAGRISADRDRCVGAGQCVLAAPALFDQDEEDGLVRVLHKRPSASQSDAVRDAVWACPSGALTLR